MLVGFKRVEYLRDDATLPVIQMPAERYAPIVSRIHVTIVEVDVKRFLDLKPLLMRPACHADRLAPKSPLSTLHLINSFERRLETSRKGLKKQHGILDTVGPAPPERVSATLGRHHHEAATERCSLVLANMFGDKIKKDRGLLLGGGRLSLNERLVHQTYRCAKFGLISLFNMVPTEGALAT